jgi:hypothetical protein
MLTVTSSTASEVYRTLLCHLIDAPEYKTAPRGQPIREILHATSCVLQPDTSPITTSDPARNAVIADYVAKEREAYALGTCQADTFIKTSKFWDKLKNPDSPPTINSDYGWIVHFKKDYGEPGFEAALTNFPGKRRTAWEWAKTALMADPDTRQAVILFSRPSFFWPGNKDVVCTLAAQFFIRAQALHLVTVMRSNDIWLGLAFDASFFQELLFKMRDELVPEVGPLAIGTWVHTAHSLHLYERNLAAAYKALGQETPDSLTQPT